MRRYELTDAQWELICDLLPSNKGQRGCPWKDHRTVLNAIVWVLRTGAPWRDLPERYGPWQTVYDRFGRWQREGLFDRILEQLQIRLDAEGKIDWDLWCVDGSSIRASRAAAGGGKKGANKSPKTTLWAAREADSAASCTWLLTAEACPLPRKSPPDNDTSRRSSKH
jgi:transposase